MTRFNMGVLVAAAVVVASLLLVQQSHLSTEPEGTMPAEAAQGSSLLSVKATLSSESTADAQKRENILKKIMGGERMKLLDDFESQMRNNNLKVQAFAEDAEPKHEANAEPKVEEEPLASPEVHNARFDELLGSPANGNEAGPVAPVAQPQLLQEPEDDVELSVEPQVPVEPPAEDEPPTGDEADIATGDTADAVTAPEEDGSIPDDTDAMSASSMLATKTTVSSSRMKLLEEFEASIRADNQKLLESGSVAVAKTSVPKDSAQHEDPAEATTEANEESSDDEEESDDD